jgi:hypothetical protein
LFRYSGPGDHARVAGRPRPQPAVRPVLRDELEVARFVVARHQVIRAVELRERGISRSAISRWTACGRLRREHRGVYVYGGGTLTPDGQRCAAQVAIGDDAAVGHIAAAMHLEFWSYGAPPRIDVVVARELRPRRGIEVHTVADCRPMP